MNERVLVRTQWVPRPLEEVFAFFENPENLEKLTPSDLGFEILSPRPIEMRAGALIDYIVRPFGVPCRWRTRIETYDRLRSFSDVQERGPYALWHHTHEFAAERGGTRMTDTVRYRLPLAPFSAVAVPLVEKELERIFEFRAEVVSALFPSRGEKSMKIVIAGGTGFIGRRLARALRERGDAVAVLSRRERPGVVAWNPSDPASVDAALAGADAVVNLCGAGVADRPWTAARRRELVDSRLVPTKALVDALGRATRKPKVLVNASAIGYYGWSGAPADEKTPAADGFLADLCARWEKEASRADVRTVLLRIGVVLGAEGGALGRMLLPFKLGLGGRLGSGTQPFPWIHVDDVVGLILAAIDDARCKGPVNAVAPASDDNAGFTKALGAALGRPTIFPVPAFVLRTALGDLSGLLLDGREVRPEAARALGYAFKHPALGPALRDLLG